MAHSIDAKVDDGILEFRVYIGYGKPEEIDHALVILDHAQELPTGRILKIVTDPGQSGVCMTTTCHRLGDRYDAIAAWIDNAWRICYSRQNLYQIGQVVD